MNTLKKSAVPFINGVNSGERKTNVIVGSLLVPALGLLLGTVVSPLLGQLPNYLSLPLNMMHTLLLILAFLVMVLPVILWVRLFEKRSIKSMGFFTENVDIKRMLMKGCVRAVALVAGILLSYILLKDTVALNELSLSRGFIILIMFIGYVFQGSIEEIIFRGYVLPVITRKFNVYIGVALSSIIFGIVHFGSGYDFPKLICLIIFGVGISIMAIADESLWGVCAFHAVYNFLDNALISSESEQGIFYIVGNPLINDTIRFAIVSGIVLLIAMTVLAKKILKNKKAMQVQ